ncbi:hypothetical protein M8C21_012591, partial [Ambrosia artemisiifolia]
RPHHRHQPKSRRLNFYSRRFTLCHFIWTSGFVCRLCNVGVLPSSGYSCRSFSNDQVLGNLPFPYLAPNANFNYKGLSFFMFGVWDTPFALNTATNIEGCMISAKLRVVDSIISQSKATAVKLNRTVRPRVVKIPIKSRHVFITGGSSGIGLAIARQAVAEGARVTILARDVNRLEQAKASIRASTGIEVDILSADVRDFEAVKKAVESSSPIDILICNHGVFSPYELVNQEMEVIKVGSFNMVKAALTDMKNRSDRRPVSIAFMSSQSGQVGIYGYTAYAASKFGLRGFAEALQQEVIADNIHVSLIFPPDTDTNSLVEENKKRPPLTKLIAASSGHVMNVDKVAKIALNGIKSGTFFVPCNFMGFWLAVGTAGASPQRSCLMAFVEVVFTGVLRIVAFGLGIEALKSGMPRERVTNVVN